MRVAPELQGENNPFHIVGAEPVGAGAWEGSEQVQDHSVSEEGNVTVDCLQLHAPSFPQRGCEAEHACLPAGRRACCWQTHGRLRCTVCVLSS